MSALVVLTTVSRLADARRLCKILLDEKLAACISISSPIESHYVWKGRKEKSSERLLIIKAPKRLYAKLEKSLKTHHPYDCPEILALPAAAVSKSYLRWLEASCR